MYKFNKVRGFIVAPIIIGGALLVASLLGGLTYKFKDKLSFFYTNNKNLVAQVWPSGPPIPTPTCSNLWYFDNTTSICQQKQFCDLYMYQGLQTFDNQSACQAASAQVWTYGSSTVPGCNNLWYFDNTTSICQQKQFCALYMYQGLQTFDNQTSCQTASAETYASSCITENGDRGGYEYGVGFRLPCCSGLIHASVNPTCPPGNYCPTVMKSTCIKSATSTSDVAPSIKVLSPNGGETLTEGSTQTITWSSVGVDKVNLYLQTFATVGQWSMSIATIAQNVSASQNQYSWQVPFGTAGTDRQIVLTQAGGNLSDGGNNPFTIIASPSCDQKCKSSGYASGVCKSFGPTLTGNAEETEYQKTNFSTGETSDCYVRQGIVGISRSCYCPQPSSIKVISPNGGENVVVGNKYNISWTSFNLLSSDNVYLRLSLATAISCNPGWLGCSSSYFINFDGVKNTGSYLWDVKNIFGNAGPNVPLPITAGNYKIDICDGSICDSSDNYFTISSPVQSTCTSFTYSNWGVCQSNNTQTRTTLSNSPLGCVGGSPVNSQSCSYVPPVVTCTSFTYSDWGVCQSNNTQYRNIITNSPSNCTGGNPVTTQTCNYSATQFSTSTFASTCDATAKAVVDSVGGCTNIDRSIYSNIYNVCCLPVVVTKETLLLLLNTALADGVIDSQEKIALLTALNSYLK